MRIGIFYINYESELSKKLEQVIERVKEVKGEMEGIEMEIYVLGSKEGEEGGVKYKKIRKGRDKVEEAINILNKITIIQKRGRYEFVVIGDEDIMINNLDYIGAIRNRIMKSGVLNMLGNICTEDERGRGIQVLSVLGMRQVFDILNMKKREGEVEMRDWREVIEETFRDKYQNSRIYIEKLEGIKGYTEGVSNNLEEYNFVRIEGEEQVQEYKEWWKRKDKRSELEKMLEGKDVAIVGNKEEEEDKSEEIDGADVVIRINNFYNYGSGRVGKKVDALILTGYSACMGTEPSQEEYIQRYRPELFLLNESINQRIQKLNKKFDNCNIHMLGNQSMETLYTTGTILLKRISRMSGIKSVRLYGFSKGDEWNSYLEEFGQLHKAMCNNEEELRNNLMKKW